MTKCTLSLFILRGFVFRTGAVLRFWPGWLWTRIAGLNLPDDVPSWGWWESIGFDSCSADYLSLYLCIDSWIQTAHAHYIADGTGLYERGPFEGGPSGRELCWADQSVCNQSGGKRPTTGFHAVDEEKRWRKDGFNEATSAMRGKCV